MKKTILAALMIAACSTAAHAQFISQDFTGLTAAELNGQGGWTFTGTNATPVINVTAGDVNFANLPVDTGNRSVTITGGGQDVGFSHTAAIAPLPDGAIYASFAMVVTDTAAFLQTDAPATNPSQSAVDDDYFFHLFAGTSGTTFLGRVFIDKGETGYYLGIRTTSGDPATYYLTELPFGTPAFVVVKLNFITGTGNDTAQIFVNRVQATEPVAADATDVTTVDFTAIGRVGLRQDSGAETPTIQIDQIRVGENWAQVVPFLPPSSVSDWTTM